MCGVHLGPLYSISTSTVIQPYLQWFENAAARELFEFQDSTSAVGTAYQKSLAMILENEVKVVLLASYNDQVVRIGDSDPVEGRPLTRRYRFMALPFRPLPILFCSERCSSMARATLRQTL